MTTLTSPALDIHSHTYDSALSAWQCRTCDTSADDCTGMTEAEAESLANEGYNLDAFRSWCAAMGEAFTYDNRHDYDDAFAGEWDSFREYADEQASELLDAEGPGEESLSRRYFDYDGFARDLLLGGDNYTSVAPGFGVYVFRAF